MDGDKLIDKNWVDIVPINIADETDYFLLILLTIGIVIILAFFVYMHAKQPTTIIKRRLKSLASHVKTQNNKYILQATEKALCKYFQVAHLSLVSFSETTVHGASWPEFKMRLHAASYAPTSPDNKITQELINQAQFFCRRWTS